MYLEGKKGVRYKGGRYKLDVKVARGSLNNRDLTLTLESIASQMTKKPYFTAPNSQKEFFYSQGYDGKTWEQNLFSPDNQRLARFVFRKTICPKMFRVRVKAAKRIGQKNYILLDKIVEGLFGFVRRINFYSDEEEKRNKEKPRTILRESQPCQSEQLDLFPPAR